MNIGVIRHLINLAKVKTPTNKIRFEYKGGYITAYPDECRLYLNSVILSNPFSSVAVDAKEIKTVWIETEENNKAIIKEELKMSI